MQSEVKVCKGVSEFHFVADCGWSIDVPKVRQYLSKTPGHALQILDEQQALRFPVHPLGLELRDLNKIEVSKIKSAPAVTFQITDMGVISAQLQFDIADRSFDELTEFAHHLDEDKNGAIREYASSLIKDLSGTIEKHIIGVEFRDQYETYRTYAIRELADGLDPMQLLNSHRSNLAHVLRGELGSLAEEQIEDALRVAISYYNNERTIIDTRSAVFLGNASFRDVSTVLGFTVVELLELKVLESFLKNLLEADDRDKSRIAKLSLKELQMVERDVAIQKGRVSNPLDLNDDQYFADVRRLVAHRIGLDKWAEELNSKLKVVEDISDSLTARRNHRWAMALEGTIVALVGYEVAHMIFDNIFGK